MRRIRSIIGLSALAVLLLGAVAYYFVNSHADQIVDALYPKPSPNHLLDDYKVNFEPTYACHDNGSAAKAQRALQDRYKSAGLWCYNSKVIRREPKLNADGTGVGTRIVAIIGCGVEGQQYAVIWWTDGAKFCEIEAPLLDQAEKIERASAH